MVIQRETSPSFREQSDLSGRNSVSEKYHVRETFGENQIENIVMASPDSEKWKLKKKIDKNCKTQSLSSHSEAIDEAEVTQIDGSDLEELRNVYNKCKAVMKKIESKYGHLLDLNEPLHGKRKKNLSDSEDSDVNICQCPANKKIVFDDDGKEITLEADLGKHICVKKLKRTRSTDHVQVNHGQVNHVQVEYDSADTTLPDDLQTLTKILRNPVIDITYRNKVIHKFKMLKQEYIDEVKFNKSSLVEQSKCDPEGVLNFKGTNLKNLPGYIIS